MEFRVGAAREFRDRNQRATCGFWAGYLAGRRHGEQLAGENSNLKYSLRNLLLRAACIPSAVVSVQNIGINHVIDRSKYRAKGKYLYVTQNKWFTNKGV
jgi:hypothetical protein